jgi:hypothetical protein
MPNATVRRKQEVQNYAVVGQTLWIFEPRGTKKIPLSQLDILHLIINEPTPCLHQQQRSFELQSFHEWPSEDCVGRRCGSTVHH